MARFSSADLSRGRGADGKGRQRTDQRPPSNDDLTLLPERTTAVW
jgi:hypothetical protein